VAILPPTLSLASSTTTSIPKDLSCCAAVRPAIPAPMITTLPLVAGLGAGAAGEATFL